MVHKLNIEEAVPATSRLRSVASQVIACMSPNLLLLDLGMAIGFATIALPDLLNASRGLSLDETQASWFGSISYLSQPIGALLSGPIVDFFGRKKATFLVNIPHLIAWTLMYFAWNLPSLFMANALLGLGTGVMEAPINAYVGEISEPTVRGALCTMTQFWTSCGVLVMYFLGTVVNWRNAALICLIAPIASMLLVLLVPETPVWLLSKGKEKQALKSLCYLRGWTSPDNVKEEFQELTVYVKKLQRCVICDQNEILDTKECPHTNMNRFKKGLLKFNYVMLSKETMRPLTLVIMYFLFYVMSGFSAMRPNLVNVCGALGMPQDGKHIALMVGVITFITTIITVALIKVLGKRKLALLSMLGTAISCTAISIYAKTNLSDSVFSYDIATFPVEKSYVPVALFYVFVVFTGFGLPWVLLGEVFPFRSRAIAQGIAAASNYVFSFIGAKTFIDLEINVRLWGTFATYAGFGYIGTIYLYCFLPETEGKTLQEIESNFNGKLRTFADDPFINFFKRFIRRPSSTIQT